MKVRFNGKVEKLNNGTILIECVTENKEIIYVPSSIARCDCTACEDNNHNECLIINASKENLKCQEIILN